ncbi:MAG: hypothetical protein KAU14_03915, partial [Thermoplasmata archaeon]|nr:hypothetical protein [Thermoplasmata archaeon]
MNRELTFSGLPIYGPENAIYPGEAGPYYHSGGAGLEFSWEYRAGPGVGAENREVTVGVNAYIPDYKAGRTAGSDGRVDYEVVDKELDPKKYYRDFTNRMSDSDIRAQFNPFVQENLPPKIRNLKIDTYFEYASVVIDLSIIFGEFGKVTVDVPIPTHIWMTVEGDVIDASGVQGVLIYVSSNGWIDFDFSAMNWVTGNGEQVFHFKNTHHSLDIPWDVYIAGKCTVEITAVDMVGNRVSMEEQWFGVIQSVVNKFMDLMRGVWNKAVSLAMKLAMFIYEKIIKDLKEKIEDKIDSILEPAKKKAEDYIMKIFFALAVLYWEYETSDSMSENAGESISEILFGDFLKTIDPLLKLLNWIGSLVSPFLKIIEGLQKIVVDFVV